MMKTEDVAAIMLPAEVRVLIFEPCTMTWLGIRDILSSAGVKREHVLRVSSLAEIDATLPRSFRANVLLLSTGMKNASLTDLLAFLLEDQGGDKPPVLVRMGAFNPLLMRLLMAFGADGVLPPDYSGTTLLHYVRMAPELTSPLRGESLLTRRERLVVLRILSGQSLSQIAGYLKLDIRTVSGYKQQVIAKLRMDQPYELRLLARRLSRSGCMA